MDRQPRTFRILEVYDVSLSRDVELRLCETLLRDSPISHLIEELATDDGHHVKAFDAKEVCFEFGRGL